MANLSQAATLAAQITPYFVFGVLVPQAGVNTDV